MADIFHVISDSTRRELLKVLLEAHESGVEELSVSDMVAKLEASQPTVSKHLKVLREAELVVVREEGQHRFYSLESEPLTMVEDFVMPFLMSGVETEVTVDYVSEDGSVQIGQDPAQADFVPERARTAAQNVGRAAGAASHQVKQLVARFKLR